MNEPNAPDGAQEPEPHPGESAQFQQETNTDGITGAPGALPGCDNDTARQAEEAVQGAEHAVRKITEAVANVTEHEMPDLELGADGVDAKSIGLLSDVELDVRIELGRTRMLVADVLRLSSDAVVELDKAAGDPVDIYVNGRRIARGEVLVLNENFCVRVSEIVDPQARTA